MYNQIYKVINFIVTFSISHKELTFVVSGGPPGKVRTRDIKIGKYFETISTEWLFLQKQFH